MLAGTAYQGPFAIPLAGTASPLSATTALIAAAVCTNTEKTDTKYLNFFNGFVS